MFNEHVGQGSQTGRSVISLVTEQVNFFSIMSVIRVNKDHGSLLTYQSSLSIIIPIMNY